jgi:hypothetical protein
MGGKPTLANGHLPLKPSPDNSHQAFKATSTTTTCGRCGADLSTFVQDIREREGRLPDNLTHPWFYDATERAQQHEHDEAAHHEGSRWRYNDITAAPNEE